MTGTNGNCASASLDGKGESLALDGMGGSAWSVISTRAPHTLRALDQAR
jgi:hypothetical protein